jgi:hypothetical protein
MICFDCVMLVMNGEAPEFETEAESAGWQHDWHVRNEGGHWVVTGDEPHFSHGPCPACGSTLGGNYMEAEFLTD